MYKVELVLRLKHIVIIIIYKIEQTRLNAFVMPQLPSFDINSSSLIANKVFPKS